MRIRTITPLATVLAFVAGSAFAQETTAEAPMADDAMTDDAMAADPMAEDGMTADDAMIAGPGIMLQGAITAGSTIKVPGVMMEGPGFLVVHEVVDGEPVIPASIGSVMVPAGTNTDVEVTTDTPLTAGGTYMLMLHDDTNGNGQYEFGEGMTDVDTPTMVDGEMVTAEFMTAM